MTTMEILQITIDKPRLPESLLLDKKSFQVASTLNRKAALQHGNFQVLFLSNPCHASGAVLISVSKRTKEM